MNKIYHGTACCRICSHRWTASVELEPHQVTPSGEPDVPDLPCPNCDHVAGDVYHDAEPDFGSECFA